MISFDYIIKDELGIHARPAGKLAKAAKEFNSEITIEKDDKSANLKRLMLLMSLGVKQGDKIKITVSGEDEQLAAQQIKKLLEEIL